MIAALAAAILNFYQLGETHLAEDEAQYALVTDDVRRGNWLRPSPYPPATYDQKPPLYFWLSAMTYDWFGEPGRYRVWSAAAGVGAVGMTAYLGARWIGPLSGLAAALLLAGHMRWLLIHGARDGTMDTMLALLHLMVLAQMTARRATWQQWVVIIASSAAASMLKPVFGVVLISSMIILVWLSKPGSERIRQLKLMCAGWFAGAAVSIFWIFVGSSGGREAGGRWLDGIGIDPLFYLRRLGDSSPLHYLAFPSLLLAAWYGSRLRQWELQLSSVVAVVWLVVLSIAGGKNGHYVYPVLPMICLAMAWAMSAGVGKATKSASAARWCGAAVLIYAVGICGYRVVVSIPDRNEIYAPQAFAALAAGEPVVLMGMGTDQLAWRNKLSLNATDCYYLLRLLERGATAREDVPAGMTGVLVVPAGEGTRADLGEPIYANGRLRVYRAGGGSR